MCLRSYLPSHTIAHLTSSTLSYLLLPLHLLFEWRHNKGLPLLIVILLLLMIPPLPHQPSPLSNNPATSQPLTKKRKAGDDINPKQKTPRTESHKKRARDQSDQTHSQDNSTEPTTKKRRHSQIPSSHSQQTPNPTNSNKGGSILTRTKKSPQSKITIISQNINGMHEPRLDEITKEANQQQANIILIQETKIKEEQEPSICFLPISAEFEVFMESPSKAQSESPKSTSEGVKVPCQP